MGELVRDVLEQIMICLDVKDLIRYKSVCKSWQSIISCPFFIKCHLNHNKEIVQKMISLQSVKSHYRFEFRCEINNMSFNFESCVILGFCNGLLCISPSVNVVLVTNPSTREVNTLTMPKNYKIYDSVCLGFGYDSSTDDYKVVLGFKKGKDRTCFKVLSLKSNDWKVVGDVEYTCVSTRNIGTLCNGALYWLMENQNGRNVVVSFDLSKEEFKVIIQPDDSRYISKYHDQLEIVEECLCILNFYRRPNGRLPYYKIWVLRNPIVEQSWELLSYELKYSCANPSDRIRRSLVNWQGVGSPLFMQSLVSPHVCKIPERKTQATNHKRNNDGNNNTGYIIPTTYEADPSAVQQPKRQSKRPRPGRYWD